MKIIKIVILFVVVSLNAQVGINTQSPEPSSILDIKTKGEMKTVTIPRINLKSITDAVTIKNPAHGLMVYNLNPNLKEGKGLYWWDDYYNKWLAVINQESRAYYANLVQYLVTQSNTPIDISNNLFYGEQGYTKGEALNSSWTEIKDLKIDFNIDKKENNSRATFSGSIGVSRYSPTEALQDISIGYGIFIDDKLVDARADMTLLRDYCGIHTFYVNALIDKLPIGNHTIKFAIKKRSKGNDSEQNGFVIGGDATYYYRDSYGYNVGEKCNKINSFEARPSATLHIIQKP